MIDTLAGEIIKALTSILGQKHEKKLKELEVTIQSLLMAERLKYDIFRDLLGERINLYKTVWTDTDIVSYNRWKKLDNGERVIDVDQIEKLRHYLIKLNEEKGYLFDPISRGFLLDLRMCCKECIEKSDRNVIHWIYEDNIDDEKFPHGIKLWMNKSGLRRSMVISMQLPEAGNALYFDIEKQKEIVMEVENTILDDAERFGLGKDKAKKLINSITKLKSIKTADNKAPVNAGISGM